MRGALVAGIAGALVLSSGVVAGAEDGSSAGSGSLTGSSSTRLEDALEGLADKGVEVEVDTGSLGVLNSGSMGAETNAPGIEREFDDEDRLNVTLTRPSGSSAPCTVALVTVDKAVELATDPSASALYEALKDEGPGVTLLKPPSITKPYKFRTSGPVEPGSYVLAAFCTTLAVPPISDVAAELLIVPNSGWGSVEQTTDLGSTLGSLALEQSPGSSESADGSVQWDSHSGPGGSAVGSNAGSTAGSGHGGSAGS